MNYIAHVFYLEGLVKPQGPITRCKILKGDTKCRFFCMFIHNFNTN